MPMQLQKGNANISLVFTLWSAEMNTLHVNSVDSFKCINHCIPARFRARLLFYKLIYNRLIERERFRHGLSYLVCIHDYRVE